LDWHTEALACCRTRLSEGIKIASSRAMIAMTTNSSMSVNAFRLSVVHLLYQQQKMSIRKRSEGIVPLLGNVLNINSESSAVFCLCLSVSYLSQVNFRPRAQRWHGAPLSLVCLADILGECLLQAPANRRNGIVRGPA